ncbi:MAG: response regulator [Bdellovibrionales bacterium]|nr:response regulator [Bdellovibrionales bacterium]
MSEEKAKDRILIVDDEPLSAAALGDRLERRGFLVKTLQQSPRAMSELESSAFDAVLLDIVMPDLGGIELLEVIRGRFPKDQLPVIMVTALNDSGDVQAAFQKGATDYITKPVNVDAAAARIHAHLAAARLQRETIRKREIAAIHSVAITYNHEINNPLTIAHGGLMKLRRERPDLAGHPALQSVETALGRIHEIVKKIDVLHKDATLKFDDYAGAKMVKLR